MDEETAFDACIKEETRKELTFLTSRNFSNLRRNILRGCRFLTCQKYLGNATCCSVFSVIYSLLFLLVFDHFPRGSVLYDLLTRKSLS